MEDGLNTETGEKFSQKAHSKELNPTKKAEVIAPPGLEHLLAEVFADINSPVPIYIDIPFSKSEAARYDPVENCIYFSLETSKLDDIVKVALQSNRDLLNEIADSYLESFDEETARGLEKRQALMEGREHLASGRTVTTKDIETFQEKRHTSRDNISQFFLNPDQSLDSDKMYDSVADHYVKLLRDYHKGYLYDEEVSSETKDTLQRLSLYLESSSLSLPESQIADAQKYLRHEIWHSQFANEIHRQRVSEQTISDVEDQISHLGFVAVGQEYSRRFANENDAEAQTKADNYDFFATNNHRMIEIAYEMMPENLKEAYLYRAYTGGIEEIIIPLMEIHQHGTISEINRLKQVPRMYWHQIGTLLPSSELIIDAIHAAESGDGLQEIIQKFNKMMEYDQFQKYLAQRDTSN